MKHAHDKEGGMDSSPRTGYASSSEFRDAFSKYAFSEIMGAVPPILSPHPHTLKAAWLETKLGPMVAISDAQGLYLLEFEGKHALEREVARLKLKTRASIILPGMADPIASIALELEAYFKGTLTEFKTPLHFWGTPFQNLVWQELKRTPYGQTRSYKAQAEAIGKHTAYRAVANANGANPLALVIPCHRIIYSNGGFAGYSAGIGRKQWLIDHEKHHA